jgi:hypothetical protein
MRGKHLTIRQIAEHHQRSERYVRMGVFIVRYGVPELMEWAKAGSMALSAAEVIAQLPIDTQREIVTLGPAIANAVVRDIRRQLREETRRRLRDGHIDVRRAAPKRSLQ